MKKSATTKAKGAGISRQRKYQQEHREQGLCVLCPESAVGSSRTRPGMPGAFCLRHLVANRERQRERLGCIRRSKCLSRSLEEAIGKRKKKSVR
jgi:hypothetical protein